MTASATRRWVLGLAALASFMGALDTLVVSTALTTIRLDLHAGIAQLEWTVAAFNLSFAVLLMPAAALGDRFGRRRWFAIGLGAFAVASAACALAPNAGALIAARAFQGAAAALMLSLSIALVGANFPPERRGSAMGVLQGLTGLSVAAGPVIGGAVAQGLAWQWIFWINVPIGLLAVPLVLWKMPESRAPGRAFDVRGVALVTVAAFGIVWALVRGNDAGWGSFEVLASFGAGALALGAFLGWERRAPAPLVPLGLFRSRGFSAGNAAMFLTFAALFAAVFFLAQFLQTGLGYGPLGAGLRLLPWTATLFFVAPVAGTLVDRIGSRPFLAGGLALQAAGFAWIALDPRANYLAMMIAGAGVSMAMPAAQAAAVNGVPDAAIGTAAGINSTLRELGGVFGIALCVAVFAGSGGYGSAADFIDGFGPAMGAAAALSFAGALVGLALRAPRTVLTPLMEGSPS